MEYIVEIHNLGMKYHSMNGEINALENINLSVSKGEFISIVGPSGCGKSTLLSLVSGLLSPTEGEILLGGRKVNGTSCEVGYMLQKDYLKKVRIKKLAIFYTQLLLLIAFFVVWELAANLKLIDSFITSQPSRVIRTLTNLYKEGQLFQHVGITCMETIVGFVLGTVAGTAIAMALAISLIVTILEVLNGFFAVDQEKIKLVQTFGANRIKILTKVVLPATVPTIINSLGQSDIGFAGPEASIYVYNEGKEDYSVVFAQLTKRDGQFLMGRKSEPDFKWSNLKGKYIIGGRKGGVPEMTLEYIIRKNGLTPGKDVNVDTAVQFNLMAGAFTGGQGDYVTLFEPTATMMEKEGKGYILASLGKESGEIPYTAYFAKKSYIEKNKDTIQKFTNAIYKGQLWVDSHTPEEIAKVIKPSFPDTEESLLAKVAKNYKDYDAWNKDPILKKESLDLLQKVMQEAGELKKTAEYDKLVNNFVVITRFLKKRVYNFFFRG